MVQHTSPKIWLSSPHMGDGEFRYVQEAFATNWIAPVGPHIERFEKALAAHAGRPAVVLSSGTAAIHLALMLAGVGRGDEVLCQSFTFSGSANPIVYQGAIPVFIDSEAASWNMCPDLLEEAILDRQKKTGRTPKAIIYVHLYGMPAKVAALQEVGRRYGIVLIEDAAEALGSTYMERAAGTFGDFSVYSFNGNKIITTSGGGALLSADAHQVDRAKYLSTQAREPAPHYEHTSIGYNYRMSNVCAAIGCGQLEVLPERVRQRRANYEHYAKALGGVPGIRFNAEPEGHFSNRWLTTILVDTEQNGGVSREDIRLALEKRNIESRPLWKPMHLQPVFSTAPAYTNGVSALLFETGLCLPSGSNLRKDELERICEIIGELRSR